MDQKVLSFRTIREVSVLPLSTNPAIRLTLQTLLTPAAKEIFANTTLVNVWNIRNTRRISSTGVDISIPISTPIHSGMSKSSTPDYSDSTVTRGNITRIPIGTIAPPCGLNSIPNIKDIRKSATPYLIKSNKLYTSIDGQFTNNLAVPPILTELLYDKLSDSSIQDLYMLYQMNLAVYPVNILAL